MSWVNKNIYSGEVKARNTLRFSFKATSPLLIKRIRPSCGECTFVKKFNNETLELPVVFKYGKIPVHLRRLREINTTKTITITYEDNTEDVLSFMVKILNYE